MCRVCARYVCVFVFILGLPLLSLSLSGYLSGDWWGIDSLIRRAFALLVLIICFLVFFVAHLFIKVVKGTFSQQINNLIVKGMAGKTFDFDLNRRQRHQHRQWNIHVNYKLIVWWIMKSIEHHTRMTDANARVQSTLWQMADILDVPCALIVSHAGQHIHCAGDFIDL